MENENKTKDGRGRLSGRFDMGKLFLGLIVLAAGLAYLAKNLGWIDFNLNLTWDQLWPLIIIFIGLSILSGRGWLSLLLGVAAVVIVLAIIANAITLNIDGEERRVRIFDTPESSTQSVNRETISIGKSDNVSAANIEINMGAGKLNLGGGSDKLISGDFESNFLALSINSRTTNDTQTVTLSEKGSFRGLGRRLNNLNLALSDEVPVNLEIDSGASDMNLDLSSVQAEEINVNTGASSLRITMGDRVASSEVAVKAGASTVAIKVPGDVGVRVEIKSGLTSRNLRDFVQKDNDTFETNNYEAAEKHIDINLDLGASSLEITRE